MGSRQIHRTLKGQVLVVEHVVAENLALVLFLFLIEIFQRVGHHEVYGFVHLNKVRIIVVIGMTLNLVLFLGVLDAELRGILPVGLLLFFTLLAIGFTKTCLDLLRTGCDVLGT